MLYLKSEHLNQIQAQALDSYPLECCGILLGTGSESSIRTVKKIWPTPNAWTPAVADEFGLAEVSFESNHSRSDRYWIDPRDLLQAQKWGRSQQCDIVGIYHSHPDHSSHPSESDRRWAWAGYSYLIVSVQCQSVEDPSPLQSISSWTLNEQHQFEAEKLVLEY